MRLVYFKNGHKHTITASNADVSFNEIRNGHRTTISIVVHEDIVLHKEDSFIYLKYTTEEASE